MNPKPSLSPLDAFVSFVQAHLGGTPFATYVAWALITYFGSSFLVLQIRSALIKEWSSAGSWLDRIIVIVSSTAAEPRLRLERSTNGPVVLYKGRVFLSWPDELTSSITAMNKASMSVAEWGSRYHLATISLCSWLGFLTIFIVHFGTLALLLTIDRHNIRDPAYIPQLQNWLDLVFIWPMILYLLQHTLFPDWRRQLDIVETSMKKISEQFDFKQASVDP
jgi:hypothetical protein